MHRLFRTLIAAFVIAGLSLVNTCAGEPVRVLSYNIHHGEGTDGKLDLERIAKIITQAKPDLVALNEVDYTNDRTFRVDQAQELARLTGLTAVPGDNFDFEGGRYGNAALVRGKVLSHKNHPLPMLREGEQRGVLVVTVELEADTPPVRFLCTHLDYRRDNAERLASVAFIEKLLAADASSTPQEIPTLLVGDLNAVPDSEVLKRFADTWENPLAAKPLPTFPADQPERQIDYILTRPAGTWKKREATVPEEPVASDHRPLLMVLERE